MAARKLADPQWREDAPAEAASNTLARKIGAGRSGPIVALLDEMRLTRECLCQLLQESAPDLQVQAVPQVSDLLASGTDQPDVLVINVKSGSIADPRLKEIRDAVRREFPDLPLLVISEQNGSLEAALDAIAGGANGFFPAGLGIGMLVAAVRLVAAGGVFLSPDVLRDFASHRLQHGMPRNAVMYLGMTDGERHIMRELQKAQAASLVISDSQTGRSQPDGSH